MKLNELMKQAPNGVIDLDGAIQRADWIDIAHLEVRPGIGLCLFVYATCLSTPYALSFEDAQATDWISV